MTTRDELKARRYPFVAQAEDDGWAIYFPDLPGCQTFAENWEDVGTKAKAIFEAWVDMYVDEGRDFPTPTIGGPPLPWDTAHFTGTRSLTTGQVAKVLGISRRRVTALAMSRDLGQLVGRDLLFTPAEVDAMRVRTPGRPPRAKAGV